MKKLIEALHVIQDECGKYDQSCNGCPLKTDYGCMVTDLEPYDWKINDEAIKALL